MGTCGVISHNVVNCIEILKTKILIVLWIISVPKVRKSSSVCQQPSLISLIINSLLVISPESEGIRE